MSKDKCNLGFWRRNLFCILAAALLLYVAGRFGFSLLSLSFHSGESLFRALGFHAIAFAVLTGPGIFLWSRLKPKTDNPFLFPVFVASTSLGSSMLILWLLYLFGIYSRFAAFAFLALLTCCLISGVVKMVRDKARLSTSFRISLSESAALAVSLLFCEGLFECMAGTPMTSWDAVVSWDKWASDIASRCGLGGYVCGAYPQGVPLVISFFYKTLLPAGANAVLSTEHLLSNGFFQFFPALLCISLIAAAREWKVNPLIPLGIALGCSEFVQAMIKQSGYVDVPLAAAMAAAIPLCAFLLAQTGKTKWIVAALTAILFPIVFIKGNGFAACVIATPMVLFLRDGKYRPILYAILMAIALSSIFYLHQWIVGSWTDIGEKSPFNHSLVVVSSHRDLINVSAAHLRDTLSQWTAFYGFGKGIAACCAWTAICLAAFALPLFSRKTRLPAVLAIAVVSIWFFTSSYDPRNVFPVLPLVSILMPLSLSHICASAAKQVRMVKAAITAVAVLCAIFSLWHTRVWDMASRIFSRYKTPVEISSGAIERQQRYLKAYRDEVRFFSASDVAKRASHVISATKAYRHLGDKGVYPLQITGLNDVGAHDIAFAAGSAQKPIFTPKEPFVPVSSLRKGFMLGHTVFIAAPVVNEVEFSVEASSNGSCEELHLSKGEVATDSGFVSVTTDIELPATATLSPMMESAKAAVAFTPYIRGNNLRLMYWTGDAREDLAFSFANFGDAKIVKVELGF